MGHIQIILQIYVQFVIKIENFAQALHITNVYHALTKILYSLMMVNAIIAIKSAKHALE